MNVTKHRRAIKELFEATPFSVRQVGNKNMYEVPCGNITLLYSYSTPVGYINGTEIFASDQFFSPTTHAHLLYWVNGKNNSVRRIPQKKIEALADKMVSHGQSLTKQAGSDSSNTTKKKKLSKRGNTAKKAVSDLIRKKAWSRGDLAKELLRRGLTRKRSLAKIKGYVSVIIADLKNTRGITVKSPRRGTYRID